MVMRRLRLTLNTKLERNNRHGHQPDSQLLEETRPARVFIAFVLGLRRGRGFIRGRHPAGDREALRHIAAERGQADTRSRVHPSR